MGRVERGVTVFRLALLTMLVGLACGGVRANDPSVSVTPVALPSLPLGLVSLSNGKAINLSVSPGAGAFRAAYDPPGRIWTITDRGPTIDCSEERDAIGPMDKQICQPGNRGKIYLLPGYVPSIYAIDIADTSARFITMVPLKGTSGKPLSGIANPLTHARSETAYAIDGRALGNDLSGVEPGGLVRTADGTFWVAEGFGPSLLEIGAGGTVKRRIVPSSLGEDYRNADYPIEPTLPAIFARRQVGRGFDGIALAPDEAHLYVAMQSALANPDAEAYRTSMLVRILKIERITGKVVRQFAYPLETVESYSQAPATMHRPARQSDVRVSELVALPGDRLLVLERLRAYSRIYMVDLATARPLPADSDREDLTPSLEQRSPAQWPEAGVEPLAKTLLFAPGQAFSPGSKLSGMAVLNDREIAVISNNDFGIDGSRTQMFRLTFPVPVFK